MLDEWIEEYSTLMENGPPESNENEYYIKLRELEDLINSVEQVEAEYDPDVDLVSKGMWVFTGKPTQYDYLSLSQRKYLALYLLDNYTAHRNAANKADRKMYQELWCKILNKQKDTETAMKDAFRYAYKKLNPVRWHDEIWMK